MFNVLADRKTFIAAHNKLAPIYPRFPLPDASINSSQKGHAHLSLTGIINTNEGHEKKTFHSFINNAQRTYFTGWNQIIPLMNGRDGSWNAGAKQCCSPPPFNQRRIFPPLLLLLLLLFLPSHISSSKWQIGKLPLLSSLVPEGSRKSLCC